MGEGPATTNRLFQHARVAEGYRVARPNLHPHVIARVRRMLASSLPLQSCLDVGCGTGLSSVALLDLALKVVGLDASTEMLRRAQDHPRICYVAASAESPPFDAGCFDLIAACGSIDWVDRSRFLPSARRLLVSKGWLVPLDFGDLGRSRQVPGLAHWRREVFLRHYPRPASADPLISAKEAETHGFAGPLEDRFALDCPFTAVQYADFLMTESSVIAAVEYGGGDAEEIRSWLARELAALFGDGPRHIEFGGYIQALRRR